LLDMPTIFERTKKCVNFVGRKAVGLVDSSLV
jgi:hypothetical protein